MKGENAGEVPLVHEEVDDVMLHNTRSDLQVEKQSEEEQADWELAEHELLPQRAELLKPPEPSPQEKPAVKQRGRGAFTYGEGGMYSDCVEATRGFNLSSTWDADPGTSDQLEARAGHVLVFSGASADVKEYDLEQLLRPYASTGMVIRLVSDTVALGVFRSPALAQQALAGIHDSKLKVELYDDAPEVHAITSERDLEPPLPRPATSVRAAQRMIAGALSAQGGGKFISAKGKVDAAAAQKQEAERRQRLQIRQQLRDEAWGDD